MHIKRYFTTNDSDVYSRFKWDNNVNVLIKNDKTGQIIFEANNLEFPTHYSKTACDIIAKMYFRKTGVPETGHEVSLKQVVHRMVNFWCLSAIDSKIIDKEDYQVLYDELAFMLISQMWAPNSPQWFNTGLYHSYGIDGNSAGHYYWDEKKNKSIPAPDGYSRSQSSACFIVNLEDSLFGKQSLSDNLNTATRLFKYGSGIGSNWSKIRGAGESLSDGGKSSGVMSFLKLFDSNAGTIKSGGVCLAPFQKIYTESGAVRVDTLARKNKKFVVLSYDPIDKRYKAKYATAWLAGNKKVMKIKTNKDQEFYLSYDHPVLLHNRECCKVEDLEPGMELFTGKILKNHGRPIVHLKDKNGTKVRLDKLLLKDINKTEIKSNEYVYHLNDNEKDCRLENLAIRKHSGSKKDFITIISDFKNYVINKFRKKLQIENHIVTSIEYVGKMEVYDVQVECTTPDDKSVNSGHNFLIWSSKSALYGIGISVSNTRRAAVINILNDDHPDILDFIRWKSREEDKVSALGKMGYDISINGDAYETVSGQNVNNSIALSDKFMHTLTDEDREWKLTGRIDNSVDKKVDARLIWDEIGFASWRSGDPGVQFMDTINKWNTCAKSGKISSSNPCFSFDTKILTDKGYVSIGELSGKNVNIVNKDGKLSYGKVSYSGKKKTIKLTLSNKITIKCTPDHIFMDIDSNEIKAKDLLNKSLMPLNSTISSYNFNNDYIKFGYLQSCGVKDERSKTKDLVYKIDINNKEVLELFGCKDNDYIVNQSNMNFKMLNKYRFIPNNLNERFLPINYWKMSLNQKRSFIRGLFEADGEIENNMIIYRTESMHFGNQLVTTLREDFGIGAYRNSDMKTYVVYIPLYKNILKFGYEINFYSTEKQNQLRKLIMDNPLKVVEITEDEVVDVYDFTEPQTNWGVIEGCIAHNCSEYLFLNDSSCNLASINILKFYDSYTKEIDIESLIHVINLIQIVMDSTIHWGYYPTPEIAENSYKFRPNGLGISNFGAFLMSFGIPYDSDEGRITGALIYSLITAQSYLTSSKIAAKIGPFKEYNKNKDCMMKIIKQHFDTCLNIDIKKDISFDAKRFHRKIWDIWKEVMKSGEEFGFRNAQVSLCAPAGTISFAMDCASTGIEPFFSHVTYKKLIDGNYIKLINPIIPETLQTLGLDESKIDSIVKYMEEHEGNIEGAPYLDSKYYNIFDTASKNGDSNRFIDPMGHVKMIASITPHMSGGASKTINMPHESTVEDIKNIYYQAWKLGCKCIALYRDGCKEVQPLTTKKEDIKSKEDINNLNYYELLKYTKSLLENKISCTRTTLPSHPKCTKDRVTMDGITFHINRSFYDNDNLGELFVTIGKHGSTVKGLMEVLCILISKALQYGIPSEEISKILRGHEFDPKGFVEDHSYIKNASSITDLISKFIDISNDNYQYCQVKPLKVSDSLPLEKEIPKDAEIIYGETCSLCGSDKLIRIGHCVYCKSCGQNSSCS